MPVLYHPPGGAAAPSAPLLPTALPAGRAQKFSALTKIAVNHDIALCAGSERGWVPSITLRPTWAVRPDGSAMQSGSGMRHHHPVKELRVLFTHPLLACPALCCCVEHGWLLPWVADFMAGCVCWESYGNEQAHSASHWAADRGHPFLRVDQDKECNMECTSGPRKPLCASDGRTFMSRCEFLRAKCRDPQLEVIRGPCKVPTPMTDTSRCVAEKKYTEQQAKKLFPQVFVPVCNPDGTYSEVSIRFNGLDRIQNFGR
ncbi:SPARC-related modular calcium-binding protein 2 [Merluccius polli]|uniref:SPARC-related modular calcium-binding protein 2 n=1 Tax=Merluccius polli TaxID=89951 RepID=A0AA47MCY7_MERPO|nr:SPARC-related modular calcium-binding protein 2 [Merluccius polli]